MPKKDLKKAKRYSDRILGSSWYNWDGDIEKHEGELREKPRLYFTVLGLELLVITAILTADAFVLIEIVFRGDPVAYALLGTLIGAPLVFWWSSYLFCLIAVAARSGRLAFSWLPRWLTLQMPFLAACGRPFGVSTDRMASSCISITNTLARLRIGHGANQRVMVLLPRCLRRDAIDEVKDFAAHWDCPVLVAGNNLAARKKVKEYGPTALIAVACERDLVGGLYDYGHKMPILVIPNVRTKGPCLDSTLDLDQLRRAFLDLFGEHARREDKPLEQTEQVDEPGPQPAAPVSAPTSTK